MLHFCRLITGCGIMKRTNQQTSSAAVLAIGAELSRRGYDVTYTMGNTARIDMLCAVPNGNQFMLQVKGISSANAFYVQKSFFEGEIQSNLFLVVVLVPRIGEEKPFRFFILTHGDAVNEFSKMPKTKRSGEPYETGFGLTWGAIKNYENAWNKFPNLR